MSQNPPQTLSVKRKRNEAPVDALIFEHTVKRQRSQLLDGHPKASPGSKFYFRRLEKPNEKPHAATAPPTPTAERRFHFDKTGSKNGRNVFIEKRAQSEEQGIAVGASTPAVSISRPTSPPRKRPGAGSALRSVSKPPAAEPKATSHEPSDKDVRALEEFSNQIAKQDNLTIPLPPSPSKHKPKAPAQRFAERHPEKAAQLAAEEAAASAADGDAMDIDTDDYVYDTYVRAPLPSTEADPANTTDLGPNIGYLVISSEDTEWWNNSDSSDKEFDTDDEDENAEDYYANDYPEDELSEDDEYDRNLYQKYRHGSDDEEYDLENDDEGALGSDENEDDLHFRMTVPKAGKGYWGKAGE